MTTTTYRATGPVPVDTAEGRVLGQGDVAEIDPTHPHNARLIQAGRLRRQGPPPKPPTKSEIQDRARDLDITGRSNMTADELREAVAAAEAAPPAETETTASPAGDGGEGDQA
jgi:hypothetical protein